MAAADNRALVPAEEAPPSFTANDLAQITPPPNTDLALLSDDIDLDAEFAAEEARADRELLRLGIFTKEELARHRGKPIDAIGKSSALTRQTIEHELAKLAELRRTDPRKYQSDAIQARELRLYELLAKLKGVPAKVTAAAEGKGHSLPDDVLDEWNKFHGVEAHLTFARKTAQSVLDELDEDERGALAYSFDHDLPEAARNQIYRFIGFDGSSGWRVADDAAVEAFASTPEGAQLVLEWGPKAAARNVGVLRGRVRLLMKGLSAEDRSKASAWVNGLSSTQAKAVWKALVPASR